jgi:hypothetical protein
MSVTWRGAESIVPVEAICTAMECIMFANYMRAFRPDLVNWIMVSLKTQ